MKTIDTFCIDTNVKGYMTEHFNQKKSMIINLLLTKFIEEHQKNPQIDEITFTIKKI